MSFDLASLDRVRLAMTLLDPLEAAAETRVIDANIALHFCLSDAGDAGAPRAICDEPANALTAAQWQRDRLRAAMKELEGWRQAYEATKRATPTTAQDERSEATSYLEPGEDVARPSNSHVHRHGMQSRANGATA
jgi:hypothetical protein